MFILEEEFKAIKLPPGAQVNAIEIPKGVYAEDYIRAHQGTKFICSTCFKLAESVINAGIAYELGSPNYESGDIVIVREEDGISTNRLMAYWVSVCTKMRKIPKRDNVQEEVRHSAIRHQGTIYIGRSHPAIRKEFGTAVSDNDLHDIPGGEDGFLTNKKRFVSRIEAAEIAFYAGQIPIEHYRLLHPKDDVYDLDNKMTVGLISENLTEYCNFVYHPSIGYIKAG